MDAGGVQGLTLVQRCPYWDIWEWTGLLRVTNLTSLCQIWVLHEWLTCRCLLWFFQKMAGTLTGEYEWWPLPTKCQHHSHILPTWLSLGPCTVDCPTLDSDPFADWRCKRSQNRSILAMEFHLQRGLFPLWEPIIYFLAWCRDARYFAGACSWEQEGSTWSTLLFSSHQIAYA